MIDRKYSSNNDENSFFIRLNTCLRVMCRFQYPVHNFEP